MTSRLGLMAWATGALVLAATSACGGTNADPSPPTSPPASSTSPTDASTNTSPRSPSDVASANASATVRRYFWVTDKLSQDSNQGLDVLAKIATSTQLSAERALLQGQRRRGERQVGDTRIANLRVQSVDLDNPDPSAGKVPTVIVDVCWDVSNVDVVNGRGTSVISSNRPDTGWTRYSVANYHYAADPEGGWRIATGQDLKQAPCAAS